MRPRPWRQSEALTTSEGADGTRRVDATASFESEHGPMIGGRGRTKRRGSTLWPRLAFDYANDIDQGSSEPEAHACAQGGRFGRSRDPAVKILPGWSTFNAKNRIELPLITRRKLRVLDLFWTVGTLRARGSLAPFARLRLPQDGTAKHRSQSDQSQ